MYTDRNFKSKKELKAAVEAWNAYVNAKANGALSISAVMTPPARPVTYHQPGPFGGNERRDGTIAVEGPHYPQAHKWYAECTVKDGMIVKVK